VHFVDLGCELFNENNVRNEQYKVYILYRYCMQTILTAFCIVTNLIYGDRSSCSRHSNVSTRSDNRQR